MAAPQRVKIVRIFAAGPFLRNLPPTTRKEIGLEWVKPLRDLLASRTHDSLPPKVGGRNSNNRPGTGVDLTKKGLLSTALLAMSSRIPPEKLGRLQGMVPHMQSTVRLGQRN